MPSQPSNMIDNTRLPKKEFQENLGYDFNDPSLLEEALTHPSICRKGKSIETGGRNYERLEFLGDGVLGLLSSELLMELYPDDAEGALAIKHAALVKGAFLTDVGRKLNIGAYLSMARGEVRIGGRENAGNLENAVEALMGAMYADGGMSPVRKFYRKHWTHIAEQMEEAEKDAKTELQEWCQKHTGNVPSYILTKAKGPDHAPTFTVKVVANGVGEAEGTAESKKKAEKCAAKELLKHLADNEADYVIAKSDEAEQVAKVEKERKSEERRKQEDSRADLERIRLNVSKKLNYSKHKTTA
ncbi:MAG: ribonuclease III [Rickettsiales bacterium]